MEMQRGSYRYWTTYFIDRDAGCDGFRLHCESFGKASVVAVVTYWDAAPGFFIRTLEGDIPVEVAEAAIQEAREKIKYY